ncbi:MAG TPA: M10 family metallopeptidase domain-containing protein [Coleofasciculaceae cyanobacterium]
MSIRRCGVPDDPSNPPTLNFTTTGQRWNQTNLTYRFGSFTPDIPQADVRAAIRTAFGLWSNVTPLTFAEINTGTPDILLNFVASIPGSTAARATWNSVSGIITNSQIIFDDSDIWALTMPIGAPSSDLVDFAAHEIGHCLGLGHSLIATAIMRPTFQNGTSQRSLAQDDINGIQSIYGFRGVRANEVIGRGGWNGSIAVANGFVYLANAAGELRRGVLDNSVNTTLIGRGGWNGSIAVADGFVYLTTPSGDLLRGRL